ncbi:hypothetical protein Gotur_000429 [Gossypium turneri]
MWNLELFRVWLSEDIIECITSILPPHPSTGSNKVAWMGTSLGCLSDKSVYRMIKKSSIELVVLQDVRFVVMNWRMYFMLSEIVLQQKMYGPGSFHLRRKPISFQFLGEFGRIEICVSFRVCRGVQRKLWIHTRSDGAIKINIGCSVAGEVLRDHNGKWIIGFNRRLGKCSIFEVELWGILDVCRWCKEDNMIEYWCKQTTWRLLGLSRNLCRSGQIQQ